MSSIPNEEKIALMNDAEFERKMIPILVQLPMTTLDMFRSKGTLTYQQFVRVVVAKGLREVDQMGSPVPPPNSILNTGRPPPEDFLRRSSKKSCSGDNRSKHAVITEPYKNRLLLFRGLLHPHEVVIDFWRYAWETIIKKRLSPRSAQWNPDHDPVRASMAGPRTNQTCFTWSRLCTSCWHGPTTSGIPGNSCRMIG